MEELRDPTNVVEREIERDNSCLPCGNLEPFEVSERRRLLLAHESNLSEPRNTRESSHPLRVAVLGEMSVEELELDGFELWLERDDLLEPRSESWSFSDERKLVEDDPTKSRDRSPRVGGGEGREIDEGYGVESEATRGEECISSESWVASRVEIPTGGEGSDEEVWDANRRGGRG